MTRSDESKRRWRDPIIREHIINGMRNSEKKHQPLTEEHKRKISEKMKGRERGPFSEEHKEKLKQSALNRWAREKMEKATINKPENIEYR